MERKKPNDYKWPTLAAVAVTAAALGAVLFTRSLAAGAVPTQGTPAQNNTSYYTPKPAASQGTGESPSPAPDGPYRVALYQGKVGVFREGEAQPFLTAEIDAYLLPREDVALLRQGLEAETLTQVRQILEDYQ